MLYEGVVIYTWGGGGAASWVPWANGPTAAHAQLAPAHASRRPRRQPRIPSPPLVASRPTPALSNTYIIFYRPYQDRHQFAHFPILTAFFHFRDRYYQTGVNA